MISKDAICELPDVAFADRSLKNEEPAVLREGKFYVLKRNGLFEIYDPGEHDRNRQSYNPLVFRLYKSVGRVQSPEAVLAILRLMS